MGKAALILALLKKKKPAIEDKTDSSEDESMMDGEGTDGADKEAVASEILDAISAKDPKALAEAWQSMNDLCSE